MVLSSLVSVVGWPVLDRLRLGPLAVSPHGIGIAVGYLAGSWVMIREAKKRGIAEEHTGSILLWALIGAIVGARFFYVIGHLSEFASFTETLAIWRGGISLIGGITGAMIFAYPLMRRHGYRFLQVMDSAAIGLALGIMVGRIGDLVIGDHLGKPTDFFLGWAYRGGTLPGPWVETGPGEWQITELANGLTETLSRGGARLLDPSTGDLVSQGAGVHQTALYDFLIAMGLLALLWWMNQKARREGVLIMTFAILYGSGRIVTDFLRVDKTWFGLTGSQWASVAAIALSLFVLLRYARRPLAGEKEPDGEPDEEDEDRPTTLFVPPDEPESASPRERERP